MSKQPQATLGYILKGYPRISETFISNEILLLEKLGFRLHLFPMRHPRESFCHKSVEQIRAEVTYLPTELVTDFFRLILPNIFLAAKRPANYGKALKMAGKRYRRTGKTATFKHLFQAGFMVNNFLLQRPDITHLHGHFAHSPTSVTMFGALLAGLPFSFTAHAKDIYTSNREQLREKIAMADFVVTCTQHNANYLREIAGTVTTPIHCIYHGIDLHLFNGPGARRETHPPYRLLTVARITEKKGLPTLYQALNHLRKRGLEFQHTLIGDGDDREVILSLIKELQLDDVCRWLGTQTHDEVLRQFKESDLFILGCEIAQNGDRDGIPNVLVESLAMGVPAVSTTVSAIPEILLNGSTGLTVQPSDDLAMADGIEKLLTDPDLRKQIIDKSQDFVTKNFDNKRWVLQLADIFRKANTRL